MLLCMMKENLSKSEISVPGPLRGKRFETKGCRITTSIGSDCVYFALYIDVPGLPGASSVWLGRISHDLTLDGPNFCASQEREYLFVDLERCCYMQKCGRIVDVDLEYQPGSNFAKDSPHFITFQPTLSTSNLLHNLLHKPTSSTCKCIDLTVYKLHRCSAEKLWCKPMDPGDNLYAVNKIAANSKYVTVLTATGVKIYALDHGEQVKEISLWKTWRHSLHLVISRKYLAVLRPLNEKEEELIRLDLETFEVQRLSLAGGIIWSMFAFGGDALVGLMNERTTSILNLSAAGSLKNTFNDRRVLNTGGYMASPIFQEAGKGFGIICGLPGCRVGSSLYGSSAHGCSQVILSWKSMNLPPALLTFKNKLGITH